MILPVRWWWWWWCCWCCRPRQLAVGQNNEPSQNLLQGRSCWVRLPSNKFPRNDLFWNSLPFHPSTVAKASKAVSDARTRSRFGWENTPRPSVGFFQSIGEFLFGPSQAKVSRSPESSMQKLIKRPDNSAFLDGRWWFEALYLFTCLLGNVFNTWFNPVLHSRKLPGTKNCQCLYMCVIFPSWPHVAGSPCRWAGGLKSMLDDWRRITMPSITCDLRCAPSLAR